MQRISITNPQNIIDGTAKKYYFKLRNTGGPKGDKGDKGDTGQTGPQGPKGDAATVAVGSTTTLPVGYDATVENVGSIYNAVLNFGIPQGPQGPQGAKGDKGDTGAQGETGPRGPQGERGTNATVYVGTTSTLNPGSQATVYNSGTDSNAVLNFGIPKGEKGDTGATGATGATGPAGQNFTPTIVTELPATGDSSKLYLTPKAHTTSTATGNPVTASVTEQAGALESFQLDGDTFQQTYTGKNLFGSQLVQGYYAFANGNYSSNSNSYVTNKDKISVTAGATYTISANKGVYKGSDYTGAGVVFFNNGTYVSSTLRPENGTFTVPSGANQVVYNFYKSNSDENITPSDIKWVQLESGSSATSYEPYVGGTPSPNPDYPQPIQTVTGEQTVEIVGKNLFDKDDFVGGNYYVASSGTITEQANYRSAVVPCLPSTTYTVSKKGQSPLRVAYCNATSVQAGDTAYGYQRDTTANSQALTITTGEQAKTLIVTYKEQGYTVDTDITSLMIEIGSTATAYAPYLKQTLPISLGTIELCKLGTYQDYIYKDGDSWKVHKATKSITITGAESETWTAQNTTNNYYSYRLTVSDADKIASSSDVALAKSDCFTSGKSSDLNTATSGYYIYQLTVTGYLRFFTGDATNKLTDFKAMLAQKTPKVVYPLTTPTETAITDQTLIAQLEAIRTASLENGANTITNTATGSNLAGDMGIGYYGYDPRNRYDKWLWLDINNEYEQIGS